ncbi:MAG: hypothetical protein GVY07_05985, partial [Bacteroidetes bacterium]|nr:hypothetical protein [Bacteroidota bacterium]
SPIFWRAKRTQTGVIDGFNQSPRRCVKKYILPYRGVLEPMEKDLKPPRTYRMSDLADKDIPRQQFSRERFRGPVAHVANHLEIFQTKNEMSFSCPF